MNKHLVPLVCALVLGLTSGCVTQLKSDIAPGTNLAALKKIHVIHQPADGRGIDGLIAERLNLMGRQATHGEKSVMPADTQAIITYQDKWMWDITMYMIELNVQVRNPQSDVAMASGHSLRTSLARKSPPDMVEEVLTELFKQPHGMFSKQAPGLCFQGYPSSQQSQLGARQARSLHE